jgi:hypothetical protein
MREGPRTAMSRHTRTFSGYGNFKGNILDYLGARRKEVRASI